MLRYKNIKIIIISYDTIKKIQYFIDFNSNIYTQTKIENILIEHIKIIIIEIVITI